MKKILHILALLLIIGTACAFDPIATMTAMSSQSQGASAPVVVAPTLVPTQAPPAILSQVNTAPLLLPSTLQPTAMPTVTPTQTVSPVASNAPRLSDIQGGIPTALQQAGVKFNGLKADKKRYRDAIATDATGNPLMINDKMGLPYFMSTGAVPYQLPGTPTKQSQNALVDGTAVYTNPDGTTTTVPLALVVDQGAFHIWYQSKHSDPFIVLR